MLLVQLRNMVCCQQHSYLHFKFRQTNYWECYKQSMSILLATKELYRQEKLLVGIH